MGKFFTEGQAITFLEKVFGDGRQSNGGKNIAFVCPMCLALKGQGYSNQKLVIRTDNFWVHCWVCGFKGKGALFRLIVKYHPSHLTEYKENFVNAEELFTKETESGTGHIPVTLPRGFTLLAELVDNLDNLHGSITKRYAIQALDYLKHKRGIKTKTELWYWKLGITDDFEARCKYRIIIPSYDANGRLSYWTGRSWLRKPYVVYKNPPADRREIIFNELNIDWTEPLTIVEGPFDLLKANQNATPVLGSEEMTLEFALLRTIIRNRTPVVLAFDPEPKAQKKQFVLAKRLLEFGVPVRILEYRSDERDIGAMNRNEFMELFEAAIQYTPEYDLQRRFKTILR